MLPAASLRHDVKQNAAARILGACAKLNIKSFIKPKWSMLATYPGAMVIVLNRSEASFLVSRALDDDASVSEAALPQPNNASHWPRRSATYRTVSPTK